VLLRAKTNQLHNNLENYNPGDSATTVCLITKFLVPLEAQQFIAWGVTH
jgi:hypothetical protein